MEQRTQRRMSLWYPRNHVVGAVPGAHDVAAAIEDLEAAGLAEDQVTAFSPEDLPEQIKKAEGRRGLLKRVWSGWDTLFTDEGGAIRRFESAAARGHHTLAVNVKDKAQAREVAEILRRHNGYEIWHYRGWVTEEL
jgi:hypothetical protein